ncbi:MAG: hypothetical protein QGF31_00130, partial [Nitrospinota bacterium]|nr:hypothetical protein [Nitrospinota bacterium]
MFWTEASLNFNKKRYVMKNLLRLIFIITMGILLTGGDCGKKPDPTPPDKEPETQDPPPPPPDPPPPVVEEPKQVEVEETVEVQKPAEVQKAVEEKEAEVVIAQQQEVEKEEI